MWLQNVTHCANSRKQRRRSKRWFSNPSSIIPFSFNKMARNNTTKLRENTLYRSKDLFISTINDNEKHLFPNFLYLRISFRKAYRRKRRIYKWIRKIELSTSILQKYNPLDAIRISKIMLKTSILQKSRTVSCAIGIKKICFLLKWSPTFSKSAAKIAISNCSLIVHFFFDKKKQDSLKNP